MMFNVNKFGGTSVGTSAAMKQVAYILSSESNSLAVLSACSGITNKLIQIAELAISSLDETIHQIDEVANFHLELADELDVSLQGREYISETAKELINLAKGINLLQEKQVSVEARIISKGELLSTYIFHKYLVENLKLSASLIFAPDYLQYDGLNYTLIKKKKLSATLDENQICVTQGFIASNPSGQITNLGRGGSDWSAAIFGAELGAAKINIWTDVDGVLTADPRIVPDAKLIDEIDYDSIKLAALLGAKVLHPETIAPAMQQGIEVCIRNTFNLECKGSLIKDSSLTNNRIVSIKKNVVLIKAKKSKELNHFLDLISDSNIITYFQQTFADEIHIFIEKESSKLGFILDNYLPKGYELVNCNLISVVLTGKKSSISPKINFDISSILSYFSNDELVLFVPMANRRTILFFLESDRMQEIANVVHKKF